MKITRQICFLAFYFLTIGFVVLILGQKIDFLDKFRPYESFVVLKGGSFLMGINDRGGINFEYPQRTANLKPFRIMLYPVTVASFKKFKFEKYKFRTEAETHGSSWVLKNFIKNNKKAIDSRRANYADADSKVALEMNMLPIYDARWNLPYGQYPKNMSPESEDNNNLIYPVVHVSHKDAFAYCAWKEMRLPTEIEWEFAARGGLKEKLYPWGDYWEIMKANLWQGKFPEENQLRDGYFGLSPVDAFEPQNNYGMRDVLGNVWEWTSTKFRNIYDDNDMGERRVLKGGSFLDSRDGDHNNDKVQIRLSARVGKFQNYTAINVGFRCAQTIEDDEEVSFDEKDFEIVNLRPPVIHGANKEQQEKTKKQVKKRRVIAEL